MMTGEGRAGRQGEASEGREAEASPDALCAEIAALRARITELEHAQALPGLPLVLLEELGERAHDGLVVASLNGAIQYANPSFRRMLRSSERIVGRDLQGFGPPGEPLYPDLTGSDQRSWRGTLAIHRHDGTSFSALAWIFMVQDVSERAAAQVMIVREIADDPCAELEVRQSQQILQAIVDNSAAVIFVKDRDGRYLSINRRFEIQHHISRVEIRGKTDYDLFSAEIAKHVRANDREVITAGAPIKVEEVVPSDDGPHTYLSVKFPMFDSHGAVAAVCGIATDITELKRAQEELIALQHRTIEAQRTSIKELSTPLLPVAEGVLVMPLIGTIEGSRSRQILEVLLDGISAQQARAAILDVTGVRVVDTEMANGLVRAAHAARLLGTEVILTGIGAAVAATLIQLGADLSSVVILSTLRAGIAYAMSRRSGSGA